MSDLGTIKGNIINEALLDQYAQDFERDWAESEVVFEPTAYNRAQNALRSLDLSVAQIEALERKAEAKHQPFDVYIQQIIRNELLTA